MSKTKKPNRFADFVQPANFPPPHWAEEVNKAIQKNIAVANARVLRGEEPFPMRRPRTAFELRQQIANGTAYYA